MQPTQHKNGSRSLAMKFFRTHYQTEPGHSSPTLTFFPRPGWNARAPFGSRTGQAMVESMIVLLLMLVVFLGVFQFFYAAAARSVLDHSAARAARAKTVGFNEWMVDKAARVAAIPVSGAMLMPEEIPPDPGRAALANARTPGRAWDIALRFTPQSQQAALENALIPEYMASPHSNQARQILNYEAWDLECDCPLKIDAVLSSGIATSRTITYTVSRAFDLLISWGDVARSVPTRSNPGRITVEGRYQIESHYDYYLDDMGW